MEDRRQQDTTQQKQSNTGMRQHQPKSPVTLHCKQGKHHKAQQPGRRRRRKMDSCIHG